MSNKTNEFKRKLLHKPTYTPKEISMMQSIHRCFKKAIPDNGGARGVPECLDMDEAFTEPFHQLSTEDTKKAIWVAQLKHGLLQSEADTMIGRICHYTYARTKRILGRKGNPNDPYNLVCYELLDWLTLKLSHAPCDETTLKMVKERCTYLDYLLDSGVFPPGKHNKQTMRGTIVSVQNVLSTTVLTIKREIANTHASEHLEKLQILGKIILSNGFQFLYQVLNNTDNPPSANLTRFRRREPNYECVANTKIGECLQILIHSQEYQSFFTEEDELNSDLSTQSNDTITPTGKPRKTDFKTLQITSNPFLDKNLPCIPSTLREAKGQTITEYLGPKTDHQPAKDTGIFLPLLEVKGLRDSFMEMHALLHELAKVFLAVGEAKALAGIGGDLLVYGVSNVQINLLMDTLTKLCASLHHCQTNIVKLCNLTYTPLIGEKNAQLAKQNGWVKNYKLVASVQSHLESAVEQCSEQTRFVKERANMILQDDWLSKAEQQTMSFADSTSKLNQHIKRFLSRNEPEEIEEVSSQPAVKSTWARATSNRSLQQAGSGGVVSIALHDDAATEETPNRLSRKLRTSLSNLKTLLLSPRDPEIKEAQPETMSTADPKEEAGPSPPVTLNKSLRTSFGNLKKAFASPRNSENFEAASASLQQPRSTSPRSSIKLPSGTNLKGSDSIRLKVNKKAAEIEWPKEGRVVSAPPQSAVVLATSPRQQTPSPEKLPAIMAATASTQPEKSKQPVCRVIELSGDPDQFLDNTTIECNLKIALTINPLATDILLQMNRIGGAGLAMINRLFLGHTLLEKLNLATNKALFAKIVKPFLCGHESVSGWVGAKVIKELLISHPALKELSISECGLTTDGATIIAEGLARNLLLETLDLSNNKIEDKGAIAICNAAMNHPKLRYIMMAGNALNEQSGKALCNLLKKNTHIIYIELGNNQIPEQLMLEIMKLLKDNQRLNQPAAVQSLSPRLSPATYDEKK